MNFNQETLLALARSQELLTTLADTEDVVVKLRSQRWTAQVGDVIAIGTCLTDALKNLALALIETNAKEARSLAKTQRLAK